MTAFEPLIPAAVSYLAARPMQADDIRISFGDVLLLASMGVATIWIGFALRFHARHDRLAAAAVGVAASTMDRLQPTPCLGYPLGRCRNVGVARRIVGWRRFGSCARSQRPG